MTASAHRMPACEGEGGDPPCWSHLFDDDRPDIIDRDDIEVLVRNFYRDAAMDDRLGPVFEAARVNWGAHIATLIDFWAWQLLGEPGYEGHPLRAHEPVHARTPLSHPHYERWLELFRDTVDASFQGPRADVAKERGRKMAAAMERLLAGVSASGDAPIEPAWRRVGRI
jgi:hemoglobin